MQTYLALLRGVNVGGKAKIKMADLVACLESAGLKNVQTYIQSGNVIFGSNEHDKSKLKKIIETKIEKTFTLSVQVVIFTAQEWQTLVKKAPKEWGRREDWKHNLLIMLDSTPMDSVLEAVGELKPAIEWMAPGDGVLYQSMSRKFFGRTTTGKLASSPIYKQMTIRNYNTTMKLADILQK